MKPQSHSSSDAESQFVRILLTDDHALFRESLSKTLEMERGFIVVGMARNAEEAIKLALASKPDIILMDIDMPGMNCFEAARRIGPLCPESRIIFLSAFLHDCFIEEALAVGARGYLTKEESAQTLLGAIRAVVGGEFHFSDVVWDRLVIKPEGIEIKASGDGATRLSLLTSRELQVLRYIAQGLSKKEVASALHISVKTVEVHTTHLMDKLKIHDRLELAKYALRERLIKE